MLGLATCDRRLVSVIVSCVSCSVVIGSDEGVVLTGQTLIGSLHKVNTGVHTYLETKYFLEGSLYLWVLNIAFHVTFLAPRILRWFLDFRKICGYLVWGKACVSA
jgi:hypothetical protein